MRTLRTLTSALVAALIASCANVTALPPPSAGPPASERPPLSPSQPPATVTALPATAATVPLSTATRPPNTTPAALRLVTPPPEARLTINCFTLLPARPAGLASNGVIVLEDGPGHKTIFMDLATGSETLVQPPDENRVSFVFSPDRRWVAYRRIVQDQMRIQVLENSLVIADARNQVIKVLPWEAGWSQLAGWLDNDRLVINLAGQDPAESTAKKPASLMILSLATGARKILRSEFPNITLEYPVPDWDNWGVTMYDTSLTRVVYASDVFETGRLSYALWDLDEQRALASVPAGLLLHTPRWSPDGSRFVVAANAQTADTWLTFELYSAARAGGQVRRLTHLTSHYAKVYIQSYTWSPDGRWIAFWFVANPEGVPFIEHGAAHLGVLDIESGAVTNTCVPGEHDASLAAARVPPPLWSPDGRQIIVESSSADGSSRVLLVDLASSVAAQIAEEVRPEGWMAGDS